MTQPFNPLVLLQKKCFPLHKTHINGSNVLIKTAICPAKIIPHTAVDKNALGPGMQQQDQLCFYCAKIVKHNTTYIPDLSFVTVRGLVTLLWIPLYYPSHHLLDPVHCSQDCAIGPTT